jgi:hypothetical protein
MREGKRVRGFKGSGFKVFYFKHFTQLLEPWSTWTLMDMGLANGVRNQSRGNI